MCNNKCLGQIIASDGKVKKEVSRRLALCYAAFNKLGKQGIWRDKSVSRRTKLTVYQVFVRAVLLFRAQTWPIGHADVNNHRCRAYAESVEIGHGDPVALLMLNFEASVKCRQLKSHHVSQIPVARERMQDGF
jgi:hypothetical protein